MRWVRSRGRLLPVIAGLLQSGTAFACTVCGSESGRAVRSGLFHGHFAATLGQLLLPGPLLWGMVGMARSGLPKSVVKSGASERRTLESAAARSLITAGVVLGIGMGGFVDGILFHQILQLHNMLSNTVPRDSLVNEQINMVWDGLFHALTWSFVAVGIWLLWKVLTREDAPRSGVALWGSVLFGWGSFNLVEGVIDHEVLQLHHVYQNGPHLLWDMVFLAAGVLLMVAGWSMVRAGFRSSVQSIPRAG